MHPWWGRRVCGREQCGGRPGPPCGWPDCPVCAAYVFWERETQVEACFSSWSPLSFSWPGIIVKTRGLESAIFGHALDPAVHPSGRQSSGRHLSFPSWACEARGRRVRDARGADGLLSVPATCPCVEAPSLWSQQVTRPPTKQCAFSCSVPGTQHIEHCTVSASGPSPCKVLG